MRQAAVSDVRARDRSDADAGNPAANGTVVVDAADLVARPSLFDYKQPPGARAPWDAAGSRPLYGSVSGRLFLAALERGWSVRAPVAEG
jgi:hypothetical protein